MGILVDGKWQTEEVYPRDASGAFVRPQSKFRRWVTADGSPGPGGDGGFEAAPGRYHLYVAIVCPWAHRARIFRKLKQLEPVVSMSICSPWRTDQGWEFEPAGELWRDHLFGVRYMHEIYVRADPAYTGRVTVPVLWDKRRETIVNNESSEIIRMFNFAFDGVTGDRADYYPEALRPEIDRLNAIIYAGLNNGVYRAGNATTQSAYETAVREVFATLDMLENLLARRRYLCGDRLTEADWRLFPTLARFDACYHYVMKCNLRRLADYPNISAYARELYQIPGIAETVDIENFKIGYWGNRERNPSGVVAIGPTVDFTAPHHRDRLALAAE